MSKLPDYSPPAPPFGLVVRDVGATVGPRVLETLYARSRMVLASRVAGIQLPDGEFVDVAIVRRAEALPRLADTLGGRDG
jgi:citrate lyase beta subunit